MDNGGGGRGYDEPVSSTRLDAIENSVEDHSRKASYNAELNTLLRNELAYLNQRDTTAITRHLDNLESAIQSPIDGKVLLMAGGSIRKHTYADGLSDIDMLVVLNDSSLINLSPSEVLEQLAQSIRDRLPNTPVKTGALAVTVTYSDGHEVQLLPAIKTQSGIRIKAPDEDKWSHVVRPESFARQLTKVNQNCGGKVVPLIKLYKSIQTDLAEVHRLSGYHIESLSVEAFRSYAGPQTHKDMMLHFCDFATKRVLSPVSDKTGQSLHIDDYLGIQDSPQRQMMSKAIGLLANRLRTADEQGDIMAWKQILPLEQRFEPSEQPPSFYDLSDLSHSDP